MRKKKLDPETLDVQGFQTLPDAGAAGGTVHGHVSGAYGPACASQCPNCPGTGSIENTDPPTG